MGVHRLSRGDEHQWLSAVEAVLSEESRHGLLAPVSDVTRALGDPGCYLLVATQGSVAVGLLCAYRFPDAISGGDIVYLYDIEVVAKERCQGFGTELIRSLVNCCEAESVKLIWAGTDTSNAAARRIFEITGAELEGSSYAEYEWDLEE